MQRASKRLGFTLIEVALAIVVVGVGVLALYSLIGTGMDMSARAVADTQAAMFAEAVFNGFRSESVEYARRYTENDNTWKRYWDAVKGGTATNLVAAPEHWANPSSMRIVVVPERLPAASLTFMNLPLRKGTPVKDIENFTLKYRIAITERGPANWPTYMMSLLIWPGRYSNTTNALRFYTEFPFVGSL